MATLTESRTGDILTGTSHHIQLNAIDWLSLVLMIVGGINWGLIGLFQFDLVAAIFGDMSGASRVVYTLVGVAAVYGIVLAVRLGKARG